MDYVIIDYGVIQEMIPVKKEEKEHVESVILELEETIGDDQLSVDDFAVKVTAIFNSKNKIDYFDDAILTAKGNLLMERGEYEKANVLLQEALSRPTDETYQDEILLFLRLAQVQFIAGNVEKGTEYLARLCEGEIDNYVEAIEHRDLIDVWNKYSHYVEGKVRESLYIEKSEARRPSECSRSMMDIAGIKDKAELLMALSEHINELCADGECLNYLNKWERTFFYLDQLWTRVNADGFDAYLSYDGNNFGRAKKASSDLRMDELTGLLEKVEARFPKSRVPKRVEKNQDIIDEQEIDFDDLDEEFYEKYDAQMEDALYEYFVEYKNRFR